MKNIVIATTKVWNIEKANQLKSCLSDYEVHVVSQQNELNENAIRNLAPEYIFFPHWSWKIQREIYSRYKCIVFHMTDLPYGRGGSPLQNLIAQGIYETKVSAIAVNDGIDEGDIYLKKPMSLYGGAEEVYMRCSSIIFDDMIPYILKYNPVPVPQSGEVTSFYRRTPEMSELKPDMSLVEIFDHIRMLDAEGYPAAHIRFGNYCIRFSRPKRTAQGIISDVFIEEVN